jgi:manganese/zinc/iron transport system permease protein
MNDVWAFFSFSDPTVRIVSLGTVFLAMSASVVGTFAFLRKRALVGDAIAHAILPGIAIAFMLSGTKNPVVLMVGALISGWLATWAMEYITEKTKLSNDTAVALVLSVFFGIGIMLLTHIQHSGSGNQSGLDQYLFGKAAGMTEQDLWTYSVVAVLLLTVVLSLYKELKVYSFNPDFAAVSGLPVKAIRRILNLVTVLAIAIGIQSVGVVLMAALLITPAAAARAWTSSLKIMLILAALIGGISGLSGSLISYLSPAMPTGPWIVMTLSIITLLSLFFAPKRGALSRLLKQRRHSEKILNENLLKVFYKLSVEGKLEQAGLIVDELQAERAINKSDFAAAIRRLKRKNWLLAEGEKLKLSSIGLVEAKRVVRLHRLWEMYLSQRLNLKEDHIHPNAESMEHIISPELEALLLKELNFPAQDPHNSPIPYSN